MKRFIVRNKAFTFLLVVTVLAILLGVFLPSLIREEEKNEIVSNIMRLEKEVGKKQILEKGDATLFLKNGILVFFLWLLGISLIGIPVLFFIYLLQVILASSEFTFLLVNLHKTKGILIFSYLFPKILTIFVYFFLVYYAVNYSLFLVRLLFGKKDYNIQGITKRYLKVLIIGIIFIMFISTIEIFIIPKILLFFA